MQASELYFITHNYPKFFKHRLSQSREDEISALVQPKALQELGGRALIYASTRIYTAEELGKHILLFNDLAQLAKKDFALSLSSIDHKVALYYKAHDNSWQLVDVNQPELPALKADERDLPTPLQHKSDRPFYPCQLMLPITLKSDYSTLKKPFYELYEDPIPFA